MMSLKEKLDWTFLVVALLGLALYHHGTTMNMAVTMENGSMQVVEKVHGSAILDYDGKARHIADTPDTSLLSDRFQVDLPDIRVRSLFLQKAVGTWAEMLSYPLEGGVNLVSIGDLLRWIGSALFLFMIPILLMRIPFRLSQDGIQFRLR